MADLMQQARAQFEVWAAERGWSLSPARTNCDVAANGRYNHPGVQRCWEAWEAAALRAAPEGFMLVQAKSVVPCGCGCHRHCCRHCGADLGGFAVRPQGVKHAG